MSWVQYKNPRHNYITIKLTDEQTRMTILALESVLDDRDIQEAPYIQRLITKLRKARLA